jgi:hypothetical protein
MVLMEYMEGISTLAHTKPDPNSKMTAGSALRAKIARVKEKKTKTRG